MASNLIKNLTQIFSPAQTTNAFSKGDRVTFQLCEFDEKSKNQSTLFDAIKKVSGIEIENNVFNKLRTIVAISESGTTGTIVGDGVKWVFDKMQYPLPDQLGSVVKNFNPQVVNSAIGAAKQVAQKVKQRNFKTSDIPGYVKDFGNFEALLGGIFVPDNVDSREATACDAINYAIDFAKDYGMKYKYLFVVQFIPNAGFAPLLQGINPSAFVKDFSIPEITIDHEEVNMYNYRTKVPKAVLFPNTSMVLYDDGRNHVMTLIENYMKTLSPLFRNENGFSLENNTFDFDGNNFSSSIRALDGSSPYYDVQAANSLATSILSEIRVYHVFLAGHYYNTYGFLNPRFSSVQIDPFSMESPDVSTVNIGFNYDSMYIEANRAFKTDKNNGQLEASSKLNNGITYKPNNITPSNPNGNNITNKADKEDGDYNVALDKQDVERQKAESLKKEAEIQKEIAKMQPVLPAVVTPVEVTTVVTPPGALQSAIDTLSTNSAEDLKNSIDSDNDADTLAVAARNAREEGDMVSAEKYSKLSREKSNEAIAFRESVNNSNIAISNYKYPPAPKGPVPFVR